MLRIAVLLLTVAPAALPAQVPGQVIVRQRVIIHVPRMPPPRFAVVRAVEWRERKGPTCIPAAELAGALLSARDRIDLVLRGGGRVRVALAGDCRGLDFYRGFYLKPAADGMICADRDTVRTRSGGRCPIERFRKLVARR